MSNECRIEGCKELSGGQPQRPRTAEGAIGGFDFQVNLIAYQALATADRVIAFTVTFTYSEHWAMRYPPGIVQSTEMIYNKFRYKIDTCNQKANGNASKIILISDRNL
jgi:hypothetical protein